MWGVLAPVIIGGCAVAGIGIAFRRLGGKLDRRGFGIFVSSVVLGGAPGLMIGFLLTAFLAALSTILLHISPW